MGESRPRRFLDIAVNIAILISAACLVALVVVRLHPPRPLTQVLPSLSLGQRMEVKGLHPSSEGSLVLVLQIGCHFCEQSMPFYRSLGPYAANKGTRLVYLLPSAKADSQAYLAEHGLPGGEILQASLDEAQVSGTPTLILLNQKDDVKNIWVGELDEAGQRRVRSALANGAGQ
jgi:hypothetical protein